jgi:hypothetical protein
MDLDREPVEQALARERLLAERRRLHLADLDRVLGHAEATSGGSEVGRDGRWALLLDCESGPSLPGSHLGGSIRGAKVRMHFNRLLLLDGPIERRER